MLNKVLRRLVPLAAAAGLLLWGCVALAAAPRLTGADRRPDPAPATGDPLVVPGGDWNNPVTMASANAHALTPDAAPPAPGPAPVAVVLALAAAALVGDLTGRRADAAPEETPGGAAAVQRQVSVTVPQLTLSPAQPVQVTTRAVTVMVPHLVTHLKTVLQERRVTVMQKVVTVKTVQVPEVYYTQETEPVYETRRVWVPDDELRRGRPYLVGGYYEAQRVQVGTTSRQAIQGQGPSP